MPLLPHDHLNLTGTNPLAAVNVPYGVTERFVHISAASAPYLRRISARRPASRPHGTGSTRITACMPDCSARRSERRREVAMLRLVGNAAATSTVLKTTEARTHGCEVLGASQITDVHNATPVAADDVITGAERATERFAAFLTGVVRSLPAQKRLDPARVQRRSNTREIVTCKRGGHSRSTML